LERFNFHNIFAKIGKKVRQKGIKMNSVEPIRDPLKIMTIKRILKKEKPPRNYLLFVMGINLANTLAKTISKMSSNPFGYRVRTLSAPKG